MSARMTSAEAIRQLNALGHPDGDKEDEHIEADDILLAVVPEDVEEAWRAADSRAEGWWYA